jgi:hypothetical protein
VPAVRGLQLPWTHVPAQQSSSVAQTPSSVLHRRPPHVNVPGLQVPPQHWLSNAHRIPSARHGPSHDAAAQVPEIQLFEQQSSSTPHAVPGTWHAASQAWVIVLQRPAQQSTSESHDSPSAEHSQNPREVQCDSQQSPSPAQARPRR